MAIRDASTAPAMTAGPVKFGRKAPIQALWIASLVSIFGNSLTALAVPWFVLETTGSASRTGITAAVTIIPIVIANFIGGALVDRTGYRLLSIFSDIVSAATVAAIPLLYLTTGLNFAGLLALMFLGAIFDAPGHTARTAMVPPLSKITGIPLERINANFGMIAAASSLFSAPLAGILIAWLGPMNVLWFNAGTFVFSSIAVVLFIPRIERPAPSGESFMRDVRSGLAYVRNHALIRTLTLGALAINFLFAPLFGIAVPFFANQELQSVRALGIMLGGEGFGALTGAFLFGRFGGRLKRRTFLIAALVCLTTPLFPLAFSSSLWVSTVLLMSIGVGSGLVNPMLGTFLQMTTPERFMGRVMGLVAAGAMVAQPAGLLIGGSLIALMGFTGFTVLMASLTCVVALAIAISPALRGLDASEPVGS
ncbi:MAG: MFS transporter [Chloroflexia bacterium]|nr:MFS transporter [Chloroflexia bacterium]